MEQPYYEIKARADNSAEVWIYEQIGEDWYSEGVTAKKFCQELAGLKASAIDLHINSPGGSVFDGQAIYNALDRHPARITTYIDGIAASIASVIALAGDKVVMADNALYMIHNPWGMAVGSAEELRKCADVLDKCRDTIVNVYRKKCGLDDAAILTAMNDETWYTADEAVAAGFVDEVTPGRQLAASVKQFDLKGLGFRQPPRDHAVTVSVEVSVGDGNSEAEAESETEAAPDTATSTGAALAATTQAPGATVKEPVMAETTTAPASGAQEAADIVTMCVQNGCAADAAGYITAGLTADQVGRKILEAKAVLQPPIPAPAAEQSGIHRVQVRHRYNPKSLIPFQSFGSRQDQERAAYEAGMWARATIHGDPVALAWCRDHSLDMRPRAALGETGGSTGTFLVPDSMEAAIIDIRQVYGVARRLCDVRPMGTAGVSRPIKISGTTAYFQADRASMTESESGWGQIQLSAKNLNALTKISNNLIEDAVIDIAADVARDHGIAFAQKEDACMVIGDGTSTYGGILGLNTLFETNYSTYKGAVVAATGTHDTLPKVDATDLSGVMGKLQQNWRRNAFWLASSVADDAVFSRLLLTAGGNTVQTLQSGVYGSFAGKPREINEYMPDNTSTDYSNKVMLLYGDFSVACVIGDRRGIVIQVLREKYADENSIGVIGTERIDMNFQYAIGNASKPGPVIALIGGAS